MPFLSVPMHWGKFYINIADLVVEGDDVVDPDGEVPVEVTGSVGGEVKGQAVQASAVHKVVQCVHVVYITAEVPYRHLKRPLLI